MTRSAKMISAAKPMPKNEIFLGLRSLSSWPAAALAPCGVFASAIFQQSMFFEDRDQTRVAKRQQRPSLELSDKHAEPKSADADRCQHRRPMQRQAVAMKCRRDKPPYFDQLHRGDQDRDGEERGGCLLHPA